MHLACVVPQERPKPALCQTDQCCDAARQSGHSCIAQQFVGRNAVQKTMRHFAAVEFISIEKSGPKLRRTGHVSAALISLQSYVQRGVTFCLVKLLSAPVGPSQRFER